MKNKTNKPIIIKPVKVNEDEYNKKELYPWIFPSLHIALGHVASGKSTFLYNLIEDYWNPIFKDNIILFSSTAKSDPIIKKLIDNDKIMLVFDTFNMDILDQVLKFIKEETNENQPYLLVFDDLLGQIADHKLGKMGHKLDQLISTYRHQPREGMISLVFLVQYHKHLSPTMRSNASYIYFLGKHSAKDLKSYSDEYSAFSNGKTEDFYNLFHNAKNNKYDILCLDFRTLSAYKMGNEFKVLYKDDTLFLDDNKLLDDQTNDLYNLKNEIKEKINNI